MTSDHGTLPGRSIDTDYLIYKPLSPVKCKKKLAIVLFSALRLVLSGACRRLQRSRPTITLVLPPPSETTNCTKYQADLEVRLASIVAIL